MFFIVYAFKGNLHVFAGQVKIVSHSEENAIRNFPRISMACTKIIKKLVCLFDLILYVPSTIFQLYRDRSSWVEPVLS